MQLKYQWSAKGVQCLLQTFPHAGEHEDAAHQCRRPPLLVGWY